MPEAVRGDLTDLTTGPHGIIPTDTCSATVFVNGIGMVRVTDKTIPHDDLPILLSGSSTVFVNGLGAGRKGDIYIGEVEHLIITGSADVFIEELGGGGEPTPSEESTFLFDDGDTLSMDSGDEFLFDA